jgi:hypothetical protein
MDALDFLQSVAGYARAQDAPTPRVKLGTIDAAYDPDTYPATLPKVVFDGELTLSGKRYPVIGSYWPHPSDRVVLLPAGTTYAIIGSVDQDASTRVGGSLVVADDASVGGDLTVTGSITAGSIAADDYTDATLQNGWTVWGNGFATPGYIKMPDGTVQLRGLMGGGSKTSNTIFTLPSGYRPGMARLFPVAASDSFGLMQIVPSGVVSLYAGTATWVSFDGILFVAGT